jgi:hypothetical protein
MRLPFFLSILLGAASLSAQPNLTELTQTLANTLQEVYVAKLTYNQSVTGDMAKSYVLTVKQISTTEKGKSTEEKWTFNLADIDPRPLRVETAKDALRVNLRALKGQKFIRYYRDGAFSGYTDKLTLYGQGIDNAREIESILKQAIPQAVTLWDQDAGLAGKSPEELIQLLRSLVQDMSLDGTDYRLRLDPAGDYPDRLKLNVVASTSKSSKQEAYVWSLGDLKADAVRIQISGVDAFVEAAAKDNMGWVYAESEGAMQNYAKSVQIRVPDPDQGKLVAAILEKLIPFGEAEIKKRLPEPAAAPDMLASLSASMGKVTSAKTETEVSLERNCQTRLSEKQGASETVYDFHFGDLNPKTVKLNMTRDRVEVSAVMQNKNSFVWTAKDGVQQNYQNDVTFLLPDVEKGRLAAHLLPDLIDRCQQAPFTGTFAILEKMVADGANQEEGVQQTLSLQSAGESCKWKLVVSSTSGKSASESTYEFNAYDLDPDQVKINVSRKTATIQLQTPKKQNIISSNVNGKQTYVSSLQFEVLDIVAAKSVQATLEQLIRACIAQ